MPSPLVLVCTTGTVGDLRPYLAMARGLRDRGHRVAMLVPCPHADAVRAAGLPCETVGTREAFEAALDDPDLWSVRKGWGVLWSGMAPWLETVRDVVGRLPAEEDCVVLAHPLMVPMADLARSLRPGLRIVTAYLAPSNLCGSHDMPSAGPMPMPGWVPLSWRRALWRVVHRRLLDPPALPALNAVRVRLGMAPVTGLVRHLFEAPQASFALFPGWFGAPQPDWPQRCPVTDFPRLECAADPPSAVSPALEAFLADGDPPVVVTPGTGHRHAADWFAAALIAVTRLGRRAVFVTAHPDQLPPSLPRHVMAVSQAPFDALLPRVAAIVHHGGIGTTAEAFRAGARQLVMPVAYDQFDNAQRVKRLGTGDVLPARRLTAARLRRRLARLLASKAVGDACARAAGATRAGPGMARVLDVLEAAVAGTARGFSPPSGERCGTSASTANPRPATDRASSSGCCGTRAPDAASGSSPGHPRS